MENGASACLRSADGLKPAHRRAADVEATDLRCAAALLVAALSAEGTSRIRGAWHLDRGYERIEEKMGSLGARIRRVKSTTIAAVGGGNEAEGRFSSPLLAQELMPPPPFTATTTRRVGGQ